MKTKCDVCGWDCQVQAPEVKTEIAVHVEIKPTQLEYERVKEDFGMTEFCLCWVCYLKSLGLTHQGEQYEQKIDSIRRRVIHG